MKIYEWAKLIERCRTSQKDYFRGVRAQRHRSAVADLLKTMRQAEYKLDSALFESIPTREQLEPDVRELLDLAGQMRDAQKDWVKLQTDRSRWKAVDLERRVDRRVEVVIENYVTTPSLFGQGGLA